MTTNSIMRYTNKALFQLKKHSPEILIVSGVVGTVVSAVMACKATLKAANILAETKTDVMMIHDLQGDIAIKESGKYTDEDAKKDLVIVYSKTAVNLAKIYAPAVILGGLSITAILTSNNILRKRNIALAAAYATIDNGFKDYRKRVVERFGEVVDRELKTGIKAQTIEEQVVDEETGEVKTIEKQVNTSEITDASGYSTYARFFDDGCKGWTKDPEYNLTFLRAQQNYANDLLKTRGYVFLNEVYRMLGIPESQAGQVVGWIYDPEDTSRDNYIDFGIYDIHKPKNRDFVNGYERTILLDFNVDGNVLNALS